MARLKGWLPWVLTPLFFAAGVKLGMWFGGADAPQPDSDPTKGQQDWPKPTPETLVSQPRAPDSAALRTPTVHEDGPAEWLARARKALGANDLNDAARWINRVLEQDPYEPGGRLLQGEWLYLRGRQEQGLRLLLEQRAFERDSRRIVEIDARLGEWLPDFVERLGADAGVEFLQLVVGQFPTEGRYMLHLARRQLDLGKHQDARYTLSPVLYDPVWGEKARELDQRIRESSRWAGGHRLPMETRGRQHLVMVEFNGRALRMLVDTGASITLLTEAAARRAGLSPAPTTRGVRMQTASGSIEAALVETHIDLGGMAIGQRDVAVHDFSVGRDVDGLLGMDILGTYEFRLDHEQAALLLRPRE